MHTRYLSNPEYTFEKVNRASMACGPMVKWAVAQVHFSEYFFDQNIFTVESNICNVEL